MESLSRRFFVRNIGLLPRTRTCLARDSLAAGCCAVHDFASRIDGRFFELEDESRLAVIDRPLKAARRDARRYERRRRADRVFSQRFGFDRTRARPIITASLARHRNRTHYAGQKYGDVEHDLPLISNLWMTNRARGQSFTIHNFVPPTDMSISSDFPSESSSEWSSLAVPSAALRDRLRDRGLGRPTNIQSAAVAAVATGGHCYVAAETGAGKTLCYLLPMIERVAQTKATASDKNVAPLGVILVPSRELQHQVCRMAGALCDSLGVTVGDRHNSGVFPDIFVSSPRRLRRYVDLADRGINSDVVRMVVIDEADTLTDDGFLDETARAIEMMDIYTEDVSMHPYCQVVFTSATLATEFDASLAAIGLKPNTVARIMSDRIKFLQHRRTQHRFIRTTMPMKPELLLDLLKDDLDKRRAHLKRRQNAAQGGLFKGSPLVAPPGTMVFVNGVRTALWLWHFLQHSTIDAAVITNAIREPGRRRREFKRFVDGHAPMLVTTDVASRGIDVTHTTHVINYDFPPHLVDYVHRAGRVGRVNQRALGVARVTSFVTRPFVPLVKRIETAVRLNRPLPDLNTNTPHVAAEHDEQKEAERMERLKRKS